MSAKRVPPASVTPPIAVRSEDLPKPVAPEPKLRIVDHAEVHRPGLDLDFHELRRAAPAPMERAPHEVLRPVANSPAGAPFDAVPGSNGADGVAKSVKAVVTAGGASVNAHDRPHSPPNASDGSAASRGGAGRGGRGQRRAPLVMTTPDDGQQAAARHDPDASSVGRDNASRGSQTKAQSSRARIRPGADDVTVKLEANGSGGRARTGDSTVKLEANGSGGRARTGDSAVKLEANGSGGRARTGDSTVKLEANGSGGRARTGDVTVKLEANGSGRRARTGDATGEMRAHDSASRGAGGDASRSRRLVEPRDVTIRNEVPKRRAGPRDVTVVDGTTRRLDLAGTDPTAVIQANERGGGAHRPPSTTGRKIKPLPPNVRPPDATVITKIIESPAKLRVTPPAAGPHSKLAGMKIRVLNSPAGVSGIAGILAAGAQIAENGLTPAPERVLGKTAPEVHGWDPSAVADWAAHHVGMLEKKVLLEDRDLGTTVANTAISSAADLARGVLQVLKLGEASAEGVERIRTAEDGYDVAIGVSMVLTDAGQVANTALGVAAPGAGLVRRLF